MMGQTDLAKESEVDGIKQSVKDEIEAVVLKTTKSGIPLVPQPSNDPDDPLNWSSFQKHAVLLVMAFDSLLVKFSATLIAPGAHALAEEFGVALSKATYPGSAPSVMYALAPLLWIPLSHRVGRRPVLLVGNLIALVAAIGVARSQSYASALGCRMVMGFGGSVGLCIAPAAISDMFFLHEKGTRMGINSILLVTAPYVGGVAGGSIQYNKSLGWRWSMYIAAILYAFQLFLQIFLVPETIYERDLARLNTAPEAKNSLYRRLGFRSITNTSNETWAQTFRRPYTMFFYPAVLLPSFWFSVFVMSEVANTAGFALNFGTTSRFTFNAAQVGFCFFAGLIGASLGETIAGPLCDLFVKRTIKRGETWRSEKYLILLLSGLVTGSTGLILYGFQLEYASSWVSPLAGIALFVFGQEILVTVLLTYMIDCYPDRAAEVAIVFQFFFSIQCFHPPFYTPQWIARSAGAKVPYLVYGLLPIVLFPFCIGIFMWKGQEIRAKGALVKIY
ncbi:major facilitator superfamily domain-containing protein [Xylogone sp. PMI_703]|nr:major facilitator superfamily domain-containing protein [Xylogone sp. PMI_703]